MAALVLVLVSQVGLDHSLVDLVACDSFILLMLVISIRKVAVCAKNQIK